MKRLFIIVMAVLALVFDTIIFKRLNLYGIRPDMMLALIISCAVYCGRVTGGVVGLAAGLVEDLLYASFLGLSAILYMLAGVAAGYFYGKFYANNVIIPGVTALVCAIAKELIVGVISVWMGASSEMFAAFIRFLVPCAILTGLVCALLHFLFQPVFTRQTRRGKNR